MEGFVLFVLKLVFYPVLGCGLVLCTAMLYKRLRTGNCLKASTPCKARLATGIIAAIALWFMAKGMPDTVSLSNFASVITFLLYAAALFVGGRDLYQRREAIRSWFVNQFSVEP